MSARKVLVTGCSSGIGLAITEQLLASGHQVVGVARQPTRSGVDHPAFLPVAIDLAELSSLPSRLSELANDHPDIDAVVANAGRGQFGGLEEFSYAQIDELLDLNLRSQIYLVRALLPGLRQHPRSDLLFMGSEAALAGGRRGAVYSASKAALRGFSQALREECSRSGVRVSLINPGMVRTPFFDQLDFAPGDEPSHAVSAKSVAETVQMVLQASAETVFDEINLSPLKKVIQKQ
ncbi:MAG: SDR family NAD(P)-dependent oxidoreductase [Gammaproteobacteria bacterium]